ncbi:MAG: EscU/YscU/HrcU family type III secretion system export apparatus switch protein [Deltaproteobacteria bacterium]|nr:EscU/YscU/HrcU family type III secretion system export apparatus switch protein [Deltaproteobacteria bacterium]
MSKTETQNKRQKAIALRYDLEDKAPHVVAAGAGEIAKKIIEIAEANNIPVYEEDSLTEVLGRISIGQQIPQETFELVAEILAFLYRTDIIFQKKQKEKFSEVQAHHG